MYELEILAQFVGYMFTVAVFMGVPMYFGCKVVVHIVSGVFHSWAHRGRVCYADAVARGGSIEYELCMLRQRMRERSADGWGE